MDVRRRPINPAPSTSAGEPLKTHNHKNQKHGKAKASSSSSAADSLLPLYLTNAIFFTLFFSVAYFLLLRWREKIRTSTPLHVVTLSDHSFDHSFCSFVCMSYCDCDCECARFVIVSYFVCACEL